MVTTNVYGLNEPSIMESMQNFAMSYFKLFSEYSEVLVDAYSKMRVREFDKIYEDWLSLADEELDRRLRSPEFIKILNDVVLNGANLHEAMRRMGYPVDIINDFIDNSIKASAVLSNIPVRSTETPHEIVRRKDDTRLLHYHSSPRYKIPMLLIYAPINRYHILDLNVNRSVVRDFLDGGLDVFLLDWGDQQNNELSIEDYLNYIDESIEEIKKRTGSAVVTLFGYCWGGVLAIIYTAFNGKKLKSLIVHATPVDFARDKSVLAEWARKFPVDKFVDEFGEMDGRILNLAFLLRNPPRYTFDKYIKFLNKMDDPKFTDDFIRVENWLYNTPDIPGELYRQFIKDLYQGNLLVQSKMKVNGRTIDLKAITVPVLNITGQRDDLAHPDSSAALNEAIASKDKELIGFPSGHVGLCVSTTAHKELWPKVVKWIQDRS